jgi:hypothetical protein
MKHLDIRYFYVKDLIDRGVVKISHCKDLIDRGVVKISRCISNEMIAVFFTKPIEGNHFKRLRDVILNHESGSAVGHRSVLENNITQDALLQQSVRDLELG